MKRFLRFIYISSICFTLIGQSYVAYSYSLNVGYVETDSSIKANRIVTKYRKKDGKRQHRRWDTVECRWVDPYWIDD